MANHVNNDEHDDEIQDGTQNGGNGQDNAVADAAAATAGTSGEPTPRERAFAERARAEEKRKLYKKLNGYEDEIKELTRKVRELSEAPPPRTASGQQSRDEKIDSLIDAVNSLTRMQKETAERIDRFDAQETARRREAELRTYARERIAEMRERGEDVIESFVGGSSEEEIDDSLLIARAEFQLAEQRIEAKRAKQNPPAPGSRGASSVTVHQDGRRPSGTPPVQTPNTVEADITESIADLTSDTAIRDGSYEKNRNKILGKLKRNFRYVSPSQA